MYSYKAIAKVDLTLDSDNDGAEDYIENFFGTDKKKTDTDGDGLTNIAEFQIGTGMVETDTDNDGLSDFDENKVYDDTFHLCIKAENDDTVKASVEMELPGYIGGAYDFSVDGKFDTATIKFEFDKSLLLDSSFDPVIYYFNEKTQLLEELHTTISGNTAAAQVTHFSKYILLNRKVFQSAFEWQDVWNSTGYTGVEVVLVIDDSGSMTSSDRTNMRLTVAKNLIDKLPEKSKVGVVLFTNYTYKLTSTVTDNKEMAKSYLTTGYFNSSGGTSMYTAINSAFSMFESTDDNIMKMMVVLSDGDTSDTGKHSSVVTAANNNNVRIYTVGLGSSSSGYFTNLF